MYMLPEFTCYQNRRKVSFILNFACDSLNVLFRMHCSGKNTFLIVQILYPIPGFSSGCELKSLNFYIRLRLCSSASQAKENHRISIINNSTNHTQNKNQTERSLRLPLLAEGRTECCTSHLSSRMTRRKVFGRTSILGGGGGGLVCCEPDDRLFFQSIPSAKCPFFYSSFSSNQPGAKWLVRIPSPNQQRRPLPSLLSDSYTMIQYHRSVYDLQYILTLRWPAAV